MTFFVMLLFVAAPAVLFSRGNGASMRAVLHDLSNQDASQGRPDSKPAPRERQTPAPEAPSFLRPAAAEETDAHYLTTARGSNITTMIPLSSPARRSTAATPCAPFNDETCLQSVYWGSAYTCTSAAQWCDSWGKDMQRCCSLACGTAYLTETACNEMGGRGTCAYPHSGSSNCEGTTFTLPAGTTFNSAPASAKGDPHLRNVHGEEFDLIAPGKHVLIQIPRKPLMYTLLRVDAEVQTLGGQCADMYFQQLHVTGAWADLERSGGFHYYAQTINNKPSRWEQFGNVKLKVVHGRTREGLKYLNFYVRDLARAGFEVGGLLGNDDHTEAAIPPEGCTHRLAL